MQDTWQKSTNPTHPSFTSSETEPHLRGRNTRLGLPGAPHHQPWSPAGQPHPKTQVEGFNGPIKAWKNSPGAGKREPGNLHVSNAEWKDEWKN